MSFNKKINGFKNEDEFVNYLNGKKIKELNPMFLKFILFLYGNTSNDDVIYCYKDYNKKKYDMYIIINNIKKYISIKKGIKNSVYVELLSSFISFLKENNISEDIINKYLLYHYADGTINGKGNARISSADYKINNQNDIDIINKCLNNNTIIENAINRFVIYGNNSKIPIDAIIYGVIDDFIWINKDEIINIIKSNYFIEKSGVGFGSLFCQPLNRCLNYNKKYEYGINYIQIKWYHLSDDIIETMNKRK